SSVIAGAAIAVGPWGWLLGGAALLTGAIIVAGDKESESRCCWQQIIDSDELESKKAALCSEHGILLSDLVARCEVFKAKDDGRIILRNKKGQNFIFSISLVVLAAEAQIHGAAWPYDVTVVHAVPVECA
ncbi:hypothetical protein FIBSPDRAFT_878192, partial [Athelia psychrophila]